MLLKFRMKKYSSGAIIVIAFLFVAFILLGMPGAITGVGWPDMRDEFGLRQDSIGMLLLAGTIGHLISGAFNGRLMYLLGGGRLILLSLIVFSFSFFGYWLTPSWLMLNGFALISGWALGTLDATGNTITAARFDDRIMNWLHGFFGVGATLGPLVISAVVAYGFNSWRGGAFVFAVLIALLVVVQLIFRPFRADTLPLDSSHLAKAGSAGEESAVSGRETLSRKVVWIAILFYFVYGGIEIAIGQWSFTIFTEARGISGDQARLWVAIYWGTFTAGRFIFGVISHWLPVNLWLRICLVGTMASVILLLFPDRPIVALLGLALSGLAQAPIFATLISNMPKLVGSNHASNAIGYVVGAAGIGIAFFPWIAGILAEAISLEAIPPYILMLTVILIVLFEALVRTSSESS